MIRSVRLGFLGFSRRGGRQLPLAFALGLAACGNGTGSRDGTGTPAFSTAPNGSAASTSSATAQPSMTGSAAPSGMSSGSAAPSTSGAPSLGGCAAALFCDDFEDDTVGQEPGEPWVTSVSNGSVEVSSDRATSGERSVHFVGEMTQYARAYMSISAAPVFPAAGQTLYGRMRVYLSPVPEAAHWTIIQAEGPSADDTYRAYYRYGGQQDGGRIMANYETEGVATDCWDHSATKLPADTWSCVEWGYSVATSEMQFWLDGRELTDIHVKGQGEGCVEHDLDDKWLSPAQFDLIRLGWEHYQDTGPHDLYIDDVALGTERIGCQ